MEKRICSKLNEFTVEQFLETFSEKVQEKMSELGYYVKDGLIYFDQEERKHAKENKNIT